MKKALVTGATGFIGANLVRRLLRDDYEVHCLVRSPDVSWRLRDVAKDVQFHAADVRSMDDVRRILQRVRPAHIYHLATAGVYRGKMAPHAELMQTNLLGLIHLLEAAKDIPYESFINTGSSSEYGAVDVPMREDLAMKPCTAYGISKLAATQYASLHAAEYDKPVVTLRLFSPYGPYDFAGRFMAYAVVSTLRKKALHLGNPTSCRDFIYVDDVVDAYMQTAKKAATIAGEVCNIGSGAEVTIHDTAKEIQRACGLKSVIAWGNADTTRPGESPRWQADITKAKRLLAWEPQTSFSSGLDRTVEWFKMNLAYYETS